MITVRELIAVGGFDEQAILAGDAFLEKELLGVTSFDSPDGHRWLRQGEFVLTTGFPFISQTEPIEAGLIRLIDSLADAGTPGLAIKLGRYIESLPSAVIEHASRKQMPILSFPMEKAWSDVIVPVVRYINDKQRSELEHTHAIYERFHQHLMAGAPVCQLAQLLHETLHMPVTIYAPYHRWNWKSPSADPSHRIAWIERQCGQPAPLSLMSQPLVPLENGSYIRWLLCGQQIQGGILLGDLHRDLHSWEKVAIEQSAALLSLEMERQRTVNETYQRFRNDFLQWLVSGHAGPRDVLTRRAQEVGWELHDHYISVVLTAEVINQKTLTCWQENHALLEMINRHFSRTSDHILTGLDRDNHVLLLVPFDDQLATRPESGILPLLKQALSPNRDFPVSIGVGRCHLGWEGISQSYREAQISLRTAFHTIDSSLAADDRPPLRIQSYRELALERILFAEQPNIEAQLLAEECLSKIVQYDAEKNGQLLQTLQVFIQMDGNHADAANRLYVHKNTIKYRLQLIRELTGLQPENGQDQLLFRIALTVHAIGRHARV
ncbi:PucR family transcriptional regulator [Brevibacillus choshinensis]|uniref:PucR family transcriptional regulator ligand-binding domain-containing protein n=1 Tax=Brevibacillus choshinensis TaxID=54911 RepID=A0ABX7FWM9_BRECH|nr:PucR family transcriptional regulator [Brevibacillus choshinensis]QRG69996.1 PucR family transcriptional regulator ligand-binding domain-containing protein [Brevibacillus choshinensis]